MYVRALTPTQDEIMYTRDPFAGADLGEGAGGAQIAGGAKIETD